MKIVNVPLYPEMFTEKERVLVRNGVLYAKSFLFSSGVCGLKMGNESGELLILPFQGQQIWRARFLGEDLTMRSMFDEPVPTEEYLKTYGGFLIHCGATAMGNPAKEDEHPQHGELPNRKYENAYLTLGEDDNGPYISLNGETEYVVAFTCGYRAQPSIRLNAGESVFHASMTLTNLRHDPLNYMYLCHINFRPVNGSHLIYSAPATPDAITVHQTDVAHLPPQQAAKLSETIETYKKDPSAHHRVDPDQQTYDPEIVMTIRFQADEAGFAHSLQQLPSGAAHYVAHRIKELPLGLRWIARTRDEDAMGLVLPATAEHFGLAYAQKHNQMKRLEGLSSVTMQMIVGYLEPESANQVKSKIERILAPVAP